MDKHREPRKLRLTKNKDLLEQMRENIKHYQGALQMSGSSQSLIDCHVFRQTSFQEAVLRRPAGEAVEERSPLSKE